ncbi:MAG: hypothetical protein JRJ59_11975 [Deltaproteobacteria bacterium]|nr:hypothetical protein [Deltaproteobacteria bacterium]
MGVPAQKLEVNTDPALSEAVNSYCRHTCRLKSGPDCATCWVNDVASGEISVEDWCRYGCDNVENARLGTCMDCLTGGPDGAQCPFLEFRELSDEARVDLYGTGEPEWPPHSEAWESGDPGAAY